MLINLDTIIDSSTFESMHEELCLGIASSEIRTPTPGVNQVGIEEPKHIIRRYNTDPMLADKVKHLSVPRQRLFLKLFERALMPGHSLHVRYPTTSYADKWDADKCVWHKNADNFPSLVKWLNTNSVFASVGRVEIFFADAYIPIPAHEDRHPNHDPKDPKEFIWVNPMGDKPFWCINADGDKEYLGKVAWFDDEILHGSDPVDWMTYSFRIDGIFTNEFREKALWVDPSIPNGGGASEIKPEWGEDWLPQLYRK